MSVNPISKAVCLALLTASTYSFAAENIEVITVTAATTKQLNSTAVAVQAFIANPLTQNRLFQTAQP